MRFGYLYSILDEFGEKCANGNDLINSVPLTLS
jgi:hypothetical protein